MLFYFLTSYSNKKDRKKSYYLFSITKIQKEIPRAFLEPV
ncbi:hypothetical protein C874_15585 [Elizabethkingia anophelis 502]|nr:hypothetical protein C874_15585 [Elizabethkingia anophelis 502]